MGASYIPSEGLEQRLAQSAEIRAAQERAAARVAETARQIAPVGDPAEDDHPGQFQESIHAEGTHVVSDDPAAAFIVYGTTDTPPHDTFARAAEINGMHVSH
jgi:hypothetical protein